MKAVEALYENALCSQNREGFLPLCRRAACWFSFVCIVDGLRGPLPHMHFQSPVHLAVFFRNFRNLFLSLIFGNNSCLCMQFLLSIESPLMFGVSASGGFLSVVRFFIGAVRLIQAEKRFFAGERYFVQLRVRPTRVLSFSRSCSAFTGCGASS